MSFLSHNFQKGKDLESQIEESEMKIERLAGSIASQSQDIDAFFAKNELSLEEIAQYAQNKENFSAKDWAQLERLRQKANEKLQRELGNIASPKKAGETRKQQSFIRPNWIFVR